MNDDVGLEDGFAIAFADEQWLNERDRAFESNGRPDTIRVAGLEEFVSVEEATSEALLGTREETILPADGTLLMYGDGGAGKTTLAIDGAFHMAAGRKWLGLEVGRPVRSLIIENEGPRGKFRQILGAKRDSWASSLNDAIHVLEEPWSKVTIADEYHRAGIAQSALELQIDLVLLGPLATIGMIGGGTPDEISAFEAKLAAIRSLVARPLAFWIIHHENKSGDVSGAWERVPDTLIHVQGRGNGQTAFVFRKARWSSERHGTTLNLSWAEARSFTVSEDKARDLYDEVLEAFNHADAWRTSKEVATLVQCRPGEAKSVLAELTRRGDLMFETGPAGRSPKAQCYRLSQATVLKLVPPEAPASEPPDGFEF